MIIIVELIAAACAYLEKGYITKHGSKRPPQCVIIIALLFSIGDVSMSYSTFVNLSAESVIEPGCINASIIGIVFSIIAFILCIIALAIFKKEEDYL